MLQTDCLKRQEYCNLQHLRLRRVSISPLTIDRFVVGLKIAQWNPQSWLVLFSGSGISAVLDCAGRRKRKQRRWLLRFFLCCDIARLLPQESGNTEVEMKRWLQKSALKILAWQLGLILTCLVSVAHARQNVNFDKSEITATLVSDGLYSLVASDGGPISYNVVVSVGSDGVLLVDSMYPPMYQKIKDAVAKITKQPIRFLINTHYHADHTGGNEQMGKAGVAIIAHESVRRHLMAGRPKNNSNGYPEMPPAPKEALPIITYNDDLILHFNGEEIYIFHVDPAHTDTDSVIYFRRANAASTGDLFLPALNYPGWDLDSGGFSSGTIAAAERVLKIVNPDTRVLPAHGAPLATVKDIQAERDMLVGVRDRVLSGIRAGETLEQIIASKPTEQFDERWRGARSPDGFVKLIYQELSRRGQ